MVCREGCNFDGNKIRVFHVAFEVILLLITQKVRVFHLAFKIILLLRTQKVKLFRLQCNLFFQGFPVTNLMSLILKRTPTVNLMNFVFFFYSVSVQFKNAKYFGRKQKLTNLDIIDKKENEKKMWNLCLKLV